LRGGVGIGRRHLQRDAEICLALLGDGIEVRHASAELAQRDVRLRPDGREARDGAGAGGKADRRRTRFEQRAAGDACLLVGDVGHCQFPFLVWF